MGSPGMATETWVCCWYFHWYVIPPENVVIHFSEHIIMSMVDRKHTFSIVDELSIALSWFILENTTHCVMGIAANGEANMAQGLSPTTQPQLKLKCVKPEDTSKRFFPYNWSLDTTGALADFWNSTTHMKISHMISWPSDIERFFVCLFFVQVARFKGISANVGIVFSCECTFKHTYSYLL